MKPVPLLVPLANRDRVSAILSALNPAAVPARDWCQIGGHWLVVAEGVSGATLRQALAGLAEVQPDLTPAPRPVPFHKRWLIAFLAVFPALVLLVYGLDPLIGGLPRPVSLLVVALALTGINTAWTLPWLHRRFHRFLAG